MIKEFWSEVKNKLLIVLSIIAALSIAANVCFGVVFFKNGIKFVKNDYITNNSSSNSYASSGALNMNIMGQTQYWNGKWEYQFKLFTSHDEITSFIKTLDICTFTLAKIDYAHMWIIYPQFIIQSSEKKGEVKSTYSEKLNQ